MNKTIVGAAAMAALGAGLYSLGLLPYPKSEPGHAASRETSPVNPTAQRRDEPAPAVTVARVAKIAIAETVLVAGTLVPRLEVLVAPEVEGLRVMELLAEEGDRVTKGQVLARLEQATLKSLLAQNDAALTKSAAAIDQARSNIVAAEARKVETSNAFDRARPLQKSGAVSESTLDTREAAARTAIAQLQVTVDGLKLAEAERALIEAQRSDIVWKLSRTDVRSPTDGVLSRRSARIGGLASGISAAQPMFHVIAQGEIELEAEVPEADLGRLKAGQQVTVNVAGAGQVKGSVRLVMPEIDKASRQGKARIGLGDNAQLRIGSFGRGTILVRSGEVTAAPAGAVLYGNDGAYVQVVVGNRIASRKVTAGLQVGDVVEIKSGLAVGEIVVAKAGTFLRSGDLVNPIEGQNVPVKAN